MTQDADNRYSVRAVLRVIDILDFLHNSSAGSSLVEVARAADLPKSSAFRYLTTLESRGYVERDEESGNYQLSLSLFLRPSVRVIAQRARPYLEEVRDRFNETANLGVLDGSRVLYLEMLESARSMRFSPRRGDRDPIHCTALGKAVAGQLPEQEVRRLLVSEGMRRMTDRTIDDPEEFLRQLEVVRQRGWAFDDGENEEGGRCVAVALRSPGVPMAISLSAPAARLSEEGIETVAAALLSVASRFAHEVGGHGSVGGKRLTEPA